VKLNSYIQISPGSAATEPRRGGRFYYVFWHWCSSMDTIKL